MNMFPIHYKFTENELKQLLGSLTILIDSREQQNQHIMIYFDKIKIPYEHTKLEIGDYSAMLPACPELGISRDVHFPITVERKNSVDELAQSIKDRKRFENELIRSQNIRFLLMVEDPNGYENILLGNYRSKYEPKALLGSLKAFEARYGFSTVFISRRTAGNYLYHHFYYFLRNFLREF